MKSPLAPMLVVVALLPACGSGGGGVRTAAIAPVFTHGVASGDMRADSAVLWTRTNGDARLVPEISRTPGFESAAALAPVEARSESDFTVKTIAAGLQPGMRYYYRFRAGDAVSPAGTFRTPYGAGDHAAVRMGFSGDADWKWKPYPLAASLAAENLDFFFFLGDVIYESADLKGKTSVEDLAGYRSKYRENREPRANSASGMVPLRELYEAFGQYSVFDNHEIGESKDRAAPPYTQGGALSGGQRVNRSEGFRARIQAYSEYQPVRTEWQRATGDARTDDTVRFYDAIPWGANVELIVLDDRSYRDARIPKADSPAADQCDRTMLGPVQLQWFERSLLAAKRRGAVWKVVVISSPIQELGRASQVGMDMDSFKGWAGNYRCERSRVLKFIDDNAIDNVVFLTTDYHITVVNNLWYDTQPGHPGSARRRARNAFEIITGPIGAATGWPLRNVVSTKGLSPAEADAKVLGTLNAALERAGLDPVGLEPDFPGLEVDSIRAAGRPAGVADPLAFVSFGSYTYAVLTFDQSHLHVQVKAMPYVADPATLLDAAAEKEYEGRRAKEAFSFAIRAAR